MFADYTRLLHEIKDLTSKLQEKERQNYQMQLQSSYAPLNTAGSEFERDSMVSSADTLKYEKEIKELQSKLLKIQGGQIEAFETQQALQKENKQLSTENRDLAK